MNWYKKELCKGMEMYACVDDGANRYLGGLKSVGNGNFILEMLRITGFKLIQIWGACILFLPSCQSSGQHPYG